MEAHLHDPHLFYPYNENYTMIAVPEPSKKVPSSFYCPLTMEVMADPVIDTEGNTFERKALLEWLSRYALSPISRQPLNSHLVVPNHALRDTIHAVMGAPWVAKRKEELEVQYLDSEKLDKQSRHSSKYRSKMECYVKKLGQEVGRGMRLEIDENGVCMFNCEDMTIVVEVPEDLGYFFVYTMMHVPFLSEKSKDTLLELNGLQNETRGGTLSAKKYEDGSYDVFFSYSDRIDEISAADFCNVIPNFIETGMRLKARLYGSPQDRLVRSAPVPQGSPLGVGMAAKYV